jgi:hypothetical protein
MGNAMQQIREGFRAYFDTPGIELPDPIPSRGEIQAEGWHITYVLFQDEQGEPYLDFFAENRFTNSRHVRILATGEAAPLEQYQEALIFQDENDDDWGRAAAAQQEQNQRVTRILEEKGLIGSRSG